MGEEKVIYRTRDKAALRISARRNMDEARVVWVVGKSKRYEITINA
jgi:hypothetical protein